MKKKIFYKNKLNPYFTVIMIFFLFIFIYYLVFYYINFNKKYFFIPSFLGEYYIIPDDRGGEKVSYTNKKSLNDLSVDHKNLKLNELKDIKFSIQLYSDIEFDNVNNFLFTLIENKSEIIDIKDLYLFSIETEIGSDFFLTYKNFQSKNDAMTYCSNITFINKCLIISPQFQ